MPSSATCRCAGVVDDQPGKDSSAALQAASTSSGPESGAVPWGSAVAGSIKGRVAPEAAGTSFPAMWL
ncbi:hypothetical protein GCM10022233_72010 [Streptomyces shaanxiensis]|uniref:Uncharacterized protein n=1 Tax=Streptomyces shaanxiensis TaxID=653357 RepID=A0ABP7W5K1_9ACTN